MYYGIYLHRETGVYTIFKIQTHQHFTFVVILITSLFAGKSCTPTSLIKQI